MSLCGFFLLLNLAAGVTAATLAVTQIYGFVTPKPNNEEIGASLSFTVPSRLSNMAYGVHQKSSRVLKKPYLNEPERTIIDPMNSRMSLYGENMTTGLKDRRIVNIGGSALSSPELNSQIEKERFTNSSTTASFNSSAMFTAETEEIYDTLTDDTSTRSSTDRSVNEEKDDEYEAYDEVAIYDTGNRTKNPNKSRAVDNGTEAATGTATATVNNIVAANNTKTAQNSNNITAAAKYMKTVDSNDIIYKKVVRKSAASLGTASNSPVSENITPTAVPAEWFSGVISSVSTTAPQKEETPVSKLFTKPKYRVLLLTAREEDTLGSNVIERASIFKQQTGEAFWQIAHASHIVQEYEMPQLSSARNMCIYCGPNAYCDSTQDPMVCVCNRDFRGSPPICYRPEADEILQSYRLLLSRKPRKQSPLELSYNSSEK